VVATIYDTRVVDQLTPVSFPLLPVESQRMINLCHPPSQDTDAQSIVLVVRGYLHPICNLLFFQSACRSVLETGETFYVSAVAWIRGQRNHWAYYIVLTAICSIISCWFAVLDVALF
jgi:hypothetical protein